MTQKYTVVIEPPPIPVVKASRSAFKVYKNLAWRITNTRDLSLLKDIEKRSFKEYHLDHKVSIFFGFKNGIPASAIADTSNSRMISSKENLLKGTSCFWDEENMWLSKYLD